MVIMAFRDFLFAGLAGLGNGRDVQHFLGVFAEQGRR
jgi:hypothetical protein